MTSIRDKFVKDFGEELAVKLENAAEEHAGGGEKGSDPFKWVLVICIGYQCFEVETYRKYHGIKKSFSTLKKWIRENADLGTHNGDCDGLSLLAGAYDPFIKKVMRKK